MKLLLFVIAAATAFAQVPAHSVLGTVTVDVADISLTVPYGAAESRAAISACSASPVSVLSFTVDYQDAPLPFYMESYALTKTDSGYCTTVLAPVDRRHINSIVVQQTSSVQVANPNAGANSAAAAQRARREVPRK